MSTVNVHCATRGWVDVEDVPRPWKCEECEKWERLFGVDCPCYVQNIYQVWVDCRGNMQVTPKEQTIADPVGGKT